MTTRFLLVGMSTFAVLLAGCTSGAAPPEANGLAKTDEIGRAAMHFAQCMRDHGYPVPDPTYNDQGLPVYGGEMAGIAKNEAFDETRRTCGEPLSAALAAAGVPTKKDAYTEELLGFARCMREHGIDVPDPTADEPLQIPKSAFNSPAWPPAKEACESLLPEHWRNVLDPPGTGDVKQGGGR